MKMDEHMHHVNSGPNAGLPLGILLGVLLVLYIAAIIVSNRQHKKWPLYRTAFWIFGTVCGAASVMGPIADSSHMNFTAHMVSHLLLGMLAPLMMVMAAPMTLLLRTLKIAHARRLSRLLKAWPVRILGNPITASILNIGGLWVLYTTELYTLMHQQNFLYLLVHIHVFLAGYLFTASMIYIDPTPHRFSFQFRTGIFILALAGHGILSKYIYANPPSDVMKVQAEAGAMLMYYAGDAIDLVLISLLCFQWYKTARPRKPLLMDP
ncbi:cytochrome c oxidase assembly protein [Peribacillus sp. NPDC097675]|uniref:cytochrome c oxidase assembly protein n=1 Tax=Peribacillus sp. NPDC097675 TaxID=3390618 RepID=UPI003D071139